jgi:glutamate-1-semialdehyde aminotransferase
MKIGPALEHLHASQRNLADELKVVAERHATEHDVYHVGSMLAGRCEQLAAGLGPFLESYGQREPNEDGADVVRAFADRVRRTAAAMVGRSEKAGLLLLRDLRELYVQAQETAIDWTIVRQGALAARDQALDISCVTGMQETERIVRWLKTRIKEGAPQALAG